MTVKMKRCDEGHFYDPERYTFCPHCGVAELSGNVSNTPMEAGKTQSWPPPKDDELDPMQTIYVQEGANEGTNSVVGWLVCIEGVDKGKDYRLKNGKNFLGRSPTMDIHIAGDLSLSRERATSITYDSKKCEFWVGPGEAKVNVYLNDDLVKAAEKLNPYSVIEIGKTKLMFVPFCGEKFKW
jgi:hypothetical protein